MPQVPVGKVVPAGARSPYYVREPQPWAVAAERLRHQQALYLLGEPVIFLLLWHVEDYQHGLVTRCPRCRPMEESIDARIAQVYQQPQTARCLFCYGTTYYGGIRAKILRPAILTDADEDEKKGRRGVTHAENLIVESTDDFRSRTGDYLLRQDGSRWQLGTPARVQVRTGFTHPTQQDDSIGYARIPAARQDESSVAFAIRPTHDEVGQILTAPVRWAQDTVHPTAPSGWTDVLNAALIPAGETQ